MMGVFTLQFFYGIYFRNFIDDNFHQRIYASIIQFYLDMECSKKAVPLHAMEALGGRGGIAPTHSRPRH
jgi:hypothetical protein